MGSAGQNIATDICGGVVISHRESVLKEMDRIIFIDAGKVVWHAGYEELIESDLYKQIQREL